ncbi:MAG: helix-turn-helix domain-containing protein [Phocaeicola sp.]
MKERIATVISKEGVTAAQFAEKIGISASSLSHILSGRNNPSLEVVTKIHRSCAYINLNWLLYGDGEMESVGSSSSENKIDSSVNSAGHVALRSNGVSHAGEVAETASEVQAEAPKEIIREQIKYIEIPSKKITEIRIFFDNGTYETFRADSK